MDAHRKVDLQSPLDLEYLVANIRSAAQDKINLAIPESAAPDGGQDKWRDTVDKLVHQYVNETISLALPSISLNGLDAPHSLLTPTEKDQDTTAVDPNDPSYEPYDARLAEQLRDLYADLEAETTRVAELRRNAPPQAAELYLQRLKEDVQTQNEAFEEARQELQRRLQGDKTELEGVGLEREEKVRETFGRALEELRDLRSVTETVATLERARAAVREIERL